MSFHIYLRLLFSEASSFFRLWEKYLHAKAEVFKVKLENTLSPFYNVIGTIIDSSGSCSSLYKPRIIKNTAGFICLRLTEN